MSIFTRLVTCRECVACDSVNTAAGPKKSSTSRHSPANRPCLPLTQRDRDDGQRVVEQVCQHKLWQEPDTYIRRCSVERVSN